MTHDLTHDLTDNLTDDRGSTVTADSVVIVVDVANVMGSRPDGWWRDRAGAASRLVTSLVPLVGRDVPLGPDGATCHVVRVLAVVEGQARGIAAPDGATPDGGAGPLELVRAARDGDSAIVEAAQGVLAAGETPLVVTADRGLRDRLPAGTLVAGPRQLLALV